jgi:hypothetical protein
MTCLRCQGLMMEIRMKETASSHSVLGWRCLMCGDATDPGIEANRKINQEPVRNRARPPGTLPGGSVGLKR